MATQKEVASHLDLTDRAVRDLISRGVLPRTAKGGLDLEVCRVAYLRHLRERAAGRESDDDEFSLTAERARLAKEQADRFALKNATSRRELAPMDQVGAGHLAMSTTISQRMEAISPRLAIEVATESDPDVCEELIEKAVHDALRELADAGHRELLREQADSDRGGESLRGDAAGTEDDSKGVGRPLPHRAKGHKPRSRAVEAAPVPDRSARGNRKTRRR